MRVSSLPHSGLGGAKKGGNAALQNIILPPRIFNGLHRRSPGRQHFRVKTACPEFAE
jgi:hypothetical protein